MRLLIDVGNTAVKLAVEERDSITFIDEDKLQWESISEVLVAQVGKSELLVPFEQQANKLGIRVIHARVTSQLGELKCAYEQFHNLGIDRWLTVVACHYLYPNTHCVIVDSGTASKVDVLHANGQHLGGWILPGLDMMIESLVSNTQKVFSDEQTQFSKALGKNTPNAVKNGALVATLGAVYAGIEMLKEEAALCQVVCAGGYGAFISQQLACESQFHESLVLQGLLFWRKNSQI